MYEFEYVGELVFQIICSSSRLRYVEVRLVNCSCPASFDIFPIVVAFCLHISSASAFHRSLFGQSSHLRCGLPRFFLKPPCFCVAYTFGNLSPVILTVCLAHFVRLLTINGMADHLQMNNPRLCVFTPAVVDEAMKIIMLFFKLHM